ncbi:MAG: hypothetical protein HIU81_08645 [Acidobacteria bacterium]|nr:hypothetical protein [Acidobacteriota bacterium]
MVLANLAIECGQNASNGKVLVGATLANDLHAKDFLDSCSLFVGDSIKSSGDTSRISFNKVCRPGTPMGLAIAAPLSAQAFLVRFSR